MTGPTIATILEKLEEHDEKFDRIFDRLTAQDDVLAQHTLQLEQHTIQLDQHTVLLEQHTVQLDQNTKKLDCHSALLHKQDEQLHHLSENQKSIIEILNIMHKQTAKIPKIESDISQLTADVSLIKSVLTDSNKQLRRHEKFIKHIKAAA